MENNNFENENISNSEEVKDSNNFFDQIHTEDSYQDYTADASYVEPVEETKANSSNGLQITGLVLGIIGMIICCCYGVPSLVLGIAGLLLGIFGNKKGKTGVGTAAIVCSIIAIVLGLVSTVVYGWVLSLMGAYAGDPNDVQALTEYFTEVFGNM